MERRWTSIDQNMAPNTIDADDDADPEDGRVPSKTVRLTAVAPGLMFTVRSRLGLTEYGPQQQPYQTRGSRIMRVPIRFVIPPAGASGGEGTAAKTAMAEAPVTPAVSSRVYSDHALRF